MHLHISLSLSFEEQEEHKIFLLTDASKSGSISENSTVHGSLSLSAVEALSFIITGCIEKS